MWRLWLLRPLILYLNMFMTHEEVQRFLLAHVVALSRMHALSSERFKARQGVQRLENSSRDKGEEWGGRWRAQEDLGSVWPSSHLNLSGPVKVALLPYSPQFKRQCCNICTSSEKLPIRNLSAFRFSGGNALRKGHGLRNSQQKSVLVLAQMFSPGSRLWYIFTSSGHKDQWLHAS